MRKWIHEKTGAIRFSDCSEKTAKGHGFIPFQEAELKEAPKTEPVSPKTEPTDLNTEPEPVKAELKPKFEQAGQKASEKPKAKTTQKRTKVD